MSEIEKYYVKLFAWVVKTQQEEVLTTIKISKEAWDSDVSFLNLELDTDEMFFLIVVVDRRRKRIKFRAAALGIVVYNMTFDLKGEGNE